jgi:hypothetical protein
VRSLGLSNSTGDLVKVATSGARPDLLVELAVDDGRLGGALDANGLLVRVVGRRLRRGAAGEQHKRQRRECGRCAAAQPRKGSRTMNGHGYGSLSLSFLGVRWLSGRFTKSSAIYVLAKRRVLPQSQESPRAKKN